MRRRVRYGVVRAGAAVEVRAVVQERAVLAVVWMGKGHRLLLISESRRECDEARPQSPSRLQFLLKLLFRSRRRTFPNPHL